MLRVEKRINNIPNIRNDQILKRKLNGCEQGRKCDSAQREVRNIKKKRQIINTNERVMDSIQVCHTKGEDEEEGCFLFVSEANERF